MTKHELNHFPLVLFIFSCTLLPTTTQKHLSRGSHVDMMGPLLRVQTISGNEAMLHCDTRPQDPEDRMIFLVWYRNDEPVYSYDTRKFGISAHWMEESIQGRAKGSLSYNSTLKFHRVGPQDRGVYRCRVDFLKSPTKNYWTALDVIEPPEKPVIFDESGNMINNVAGPYNEGSDFKLICGVNGGVPHPRLQWLRENSILKTLPGENDESENIPVFRSLTLEFKNVTRDHYLSKYTCTADNTILAPRQTTLVQVDLYLKPLTVKILYENLFLSVGRKAELWCRSTGARPPANITWWLNGVLLYSASHYSKQHGGNESLSKLVWTPVKENHGKVLICKAEHSKFQTSALETKLVLNVSYKPETTMQFGDKINPNRIEEGHDVYFECKADANPTAYKVVWKHNDVELKYNQTKGLIFMTKTNLVLRNVTHHQSGNYTCKASNTEGDGESNPVFMQVLHKPFCTNRNMKVLGTTLEEPVTIVCQVIAHPPPDDFEWVLNNTLGSIKVESQRYTIEATAGKSVLTYTPVSYLDYGTLSCRARNLAGLQTTPCVYALLLATRPDPPSNCGLYNLADDELELTCLPGYHGGLKNVYVAEVWKDANLVVNASNSDAVWTFRSLGKNWHLRVVVYAVNAMGHSEHINYTMKQSTVTEEQEIVQKSWTAGNMLIMVILLMIILCLALTATRRLLHRRRDTETSVCQPVSPTEFADDENMNSINVSRTCAKPTPLILYSSHAKIQTSACAFGTRKISWEIVTKRTRLQESRV